MAQVQTVEVVPNITSSHIPNGSYLVDGTEHFNGNSHHTSSSSIKHVSRDKYRHVAAVHNRSRTSCLSHESNTTPSFLGFRNLMVIVISGFSL